MNPDETPGLWTRDFTIIVYDPAMHDTSTEQPELTDPGNGHMVFGFKAEIEQYRIKRFTT